jgi:antitoxin component of MazEF toxin-antitoxin module
MESTHVTIRQIGNSQGVVIPKPLLAQSGPYRGNQYEPVSCDGGRRKAHAVQTAETWFATLRGRGNLNTALAFLSRSGGEPPRAGDEPDGLT